MIKSLKPIWSVCCFLNPKSRKAFKQMIRLVVDGIECCQAGEKFDPTKPIARTDGRGWTRLGTGRLDWGFTFDEDVKAGVLPDSVSTFEQGVSPSGLGVVTINDPVHGYRGPVTILAISDGAFAYVQRIEATS